jgi:ketosteroid isomerase-like protein
VSSANLDLVRSIYGPWERGDWFSSAEWAHSEIEFVIVDGPDPGSWTGIAAMAKAWGDVMSVLEDGRIEVNEYRELDDERVLVLVIFHGRGKTSGLEVGSQMATKAANLLHIRNGKVTRIAIINDRERALAELGLPSELGSQRS